MLIAIAVCAAVFFAVVGPVVLLSIHRIGAPEIGLVTRGLSLHSLDRDDPVAFNGEAGYQADLLMPGLRFKLWPLYSVSRHPWVQVPAGEIGVVIAQVGRPLPIGAKSAVYRREFGTFSDVRGFVDHGGQKGVQRPVLPPGTLVPVHPVGFVVLTRSAVYGVPASPDLRAGAGKGGRVTPGPSGFVRSSCSSRSSSRSRARTAWASRRRSRATRCRARSPRARWTSCLTCS